METQQYIQNLLIALKRVHSHHIIHRDVKPSNFLYNRKHSYYMLVDFGLAQELPPPTGSSSTSNIINSSTTSIKELENKSKDVILNKKDGVSEEKDSVTQITSATVSMKREREDDMPDNNSSQKPIKKARYTSINNVPKPKLENVENKNNDDISQQQQNVRQIVASPFKTPFKQFNEILNNKKTMSPLEANVKSAVVGHNLNILMQDETRKQQRTSSSTNIMETKYKRNLDNICLCSGRNMICNICMVKKEMAASRAGTPGYRPPEVLLKSNEQGTAIDIWAVGAIFIAILSKCYPFFKANDDFMALGEVIAVFGDEGIRNTARLLSKLTN